MNKKFAVVYWVEDYTQDAFYIRLCIKSMNSILKFNKNVDIHVFSPHKLNPKAFHPNTKLINCKNEFDKRSNNLSKKYGKYSILKNKFEGYDFIIYIDNDVFANCDIEKLFNHYSKYDFAARPDTGSGKRGIHLMNKNLRKFDVEMILKNKKKYEMTPSFFNTGLYLIRTSFTQRVYESFRKQIKKKINCPYYFRKVSTGKFIGDVDESVEEIYFTMAVKDYISKIGIMSKKDHGFYWEGDRVRDSDVLHYSSFFCRHLDKKHFQRLRDEIGNLRLLLKQIGI